MTGHLRTRGDLEALRDHGPSSVEPDILGDVIGTALAYLDQAEAAEAEREQLRVTLVAALAELEEDRPSAAELILAAPVTEDEVRALMSQTERLMAAEGRAAAAEERITRVEALCDSRAAGDKAFLVVAEVRGALRGTDTKEQT